MVGKKGGIISSIKSLLNPAADENYILIRNIYQSPQNEAFNSYLIDYKTSEILAKYTLNTNETNCISIEKNTFYLMFSLYRRLPRYSRLCESTQRTFIHGTHPSSTFIYIE